MTYQTSSPRMAGLASVVEAKAVVSAKGWCPAFRHLDFHSGAWKMKALGLCLRVTSGTAVEAMLQRQNLPFP